MPEFAAGAGDIGDDQNRFRPNALESYTRYYTGVTRGEHRVIEGKLLAARDIREKPGIRLVDQAGIRAAHHHGWRLRRHTDHL
jgi:hypothetical protein